MFLLFHRPVFGEILQLSRGRKREVRSQVQVTGVIFVLWSDVWNSTVKYIPGMAGMEMETGLQERAQYLQRVVPCSPLCRKVHYNTESTLLLGILF